MGNTCSQQDQSSRVFVGQDWAAMSLFLSFSSNEWVFEREGESIDEDSLAYYPVPSVLLPYIELLLEFIPLSLKMYCFLGVHSVCIKSGKAIKKAWEGNDQFPFLKF